MNMYSVQQASEIRYDSELLQWPSVNSLILVVHETKLQECITFPFLDC